MGSFSIWHWLIVLLIILLVFGTKKLTGGARDLGKAVDEFKKGMRGGDDDSTGSGPAARIGEDKAADAGTDKTAQRERDDVAR